MGVYDVYTQANQSGLNNLINSRANVVAPPRIAAFMAGINAARQRNMEQQKLDAAKQQSQALSDYRLAGIDVKNEEGTVKKLKSINDAISGAQDPTSLGPLLKTIFPDFAPHIDQAIAARTNPGGMGIVVGQKQQEIENKAPVLAAQARNLGAQADYTIGPKTGLTNAQTGLTEAKTETETTSRDPKLEKLMAEIELIKHNAQKPFTVNVNAGSVPGSANWDRIRKAEESKTLKEQALQGATYDLDRLGQAANDLKNHPGLGRITGVMSLLPNVPGNDAANAAAKLDTIKSQIAFNVLQSLRSMSKTGGALGQVSDKEEAMLSNNLAALDAKQGTPEFKKALDNIIRYTQDVKARLSNAAKLDVGVNSSGNQLPQGATEMGVENGKTWYRWASDGRRHTTPPQVR